MALVVVELKTLGYEPDTLTTRPPSIYVTIKITLQ